MAIRAQRAIPIAVLLATACHDPTPDLHSDHADVFLDPEIQICAGELARSDAFIERIFQLWTGGPPDIRFELHALAELADAPCSENGTGCSSGSAIYYDHQISPDFLAVRAMIEHTDGRSAPLFDPGVPIAFAPFSTLVYAQSQVQGFDPSLLALPHPDAYDAGKLALVGRYLIDRFGSSPFRAYLRAMAPADNRTAEAVASEFVAQFGEPLDVAWLDFQSSPRCAYDFHFCEEGTPIELPFVLDAIDCEDPNTIGYSAPTLASDGDLPYRPQQIFFLDNESPRTVTLEKAAGSVIVIPCGTCSHDLSWGSDPAVAELELEAGRYAVIASEIEGDVQLSISAQ